MSACWPRGGWGGSNSGSECSDVLKPTALLPAVTCGAGSLPSSRSRPRGRRHGAGVQRRRVSAGSVHVRVAVVDDSAIVRQVVAEVLARADDYLSVPLHAPTSGTVGGIDRSAAANAYWRNNVATGLTTTTSTGTILNQMEVMFRQCARNGGRPDLIVAGSTFIDGYRNFVLNTFGRMDFGPSNTKRVEGGTSVLTFQGVEVQWSPEFQELDSRYAPATVWEKRCYFLNTQTITLRPLQGHDMISRKPPRAYDRYEYYWGLTWRGALTMNRANANAVLALT